MACLDVYDEGLFSLIQGRFRAGALRASIKTVLANRIEWPLPEARSVMVLVEGEDRAGLGI